LVLLDIGLPSLNGLEAMNRIRQGAPGVKIVFLTENDDKDVVQAALSAGVQEYILKMTGSRAAGRVVEREKQVPPLRRRWRSGSVGMTGI
jgi:DNA-binding NarL/FixJ family response regulator